MLTAELEKELRDWLKFSSYHGLDFRSAIKNMMDEIDKLREIQKAYIHQIKGMQKEIDRLEERLYED